MSRPRAVRAKAFLIERDGPYCYWCGADLDEHTGTLDHVIPNAAGGSWTRQNYVLACDRCNRLKGPTHPWVWVAALVSDEETEAWLKEHRRHVGMARQARLGRRTRRNSIVNGRQRRQRKR